MTAIVECDGVWKSYRVRRPIGLKNLLVSPRRTHETRFARQWALHDVSFQVQRGQAFGIVGPNGSGKTTLLSVLLGTLPADRGRVEVRGRTAPLLELGAGFHGELTGRENVFLYGSILGMTLRELRSRFDAIAEFSELEDAIDAPLRTYSAGMIVRLGFSVIVQSPADLILIDEVLAVGDARFREKCKDHLLRFKRNNGTLIIVSHNMSELADVCDEGVLLDSGQVTQRGPIARVIESYIGRPWPAAAAR